MSKKVDTGRAFNKALVEHLGLKSRQVFEPLTINTALDQIFSVTLNVALSAEDLKAVAERMMLKTDAEYKARTNYNELERKKKECTERALLTTLLLKYGAGGE